MCRGVEGLARFSSSQPQQIRLNKALNVLLVHALVLNDCMNLQRVQLCLVEHMGVGFLTSIFHLLFNFNNQIHL